MATSKNETRAFRITIETPQASTFREALARAGYESEDTGERIATDSGPNGEAVITVLVPREACVSRADRVAALLRP